MATSTNEKAKTRPKQLNLYISEEVQRAAKELASIMSTEYPDMLDNKGAPSVSAMFRELVKKERRERGLQTPES